MDMMSFFLGAVVGMIATAWEYKREYDRTKEPEPTFSSSNKHIKNVFRTDPGLRQTYIANIAMLLHDRHGITDYTARNKAANDILNLIFDEPLDKPELKEKL